MAKELAVGAAGLAAVVVGAPALLAALAVPVVALSFTRVKGRDERRARQVLERMLEVDESPESFAEHLRGRLETDDENTLTAFRALLIAAVEAITPKAIAPLGLIGRGYVRGECPGWIARGALEVLQRVDSAELDALSRLLVEVEPIKSDGITIIADLRADHAWCAYQESVPDDQNTITPFIEARRVFGYLKRAGLGTDTSAYGTVGSPAVVILSREAADILRNALTASAFSTAE